VQKHTIKVIVVTFLNDGKAENILMRNHKDICFFKPCPSPKLLRLSQLSIYFASLFLKLQRL